MAKIKNLFGGIHMSWKKVIVFAVITGVYTGLINLVPFLKDTSFQDIAVTLEWWVLFAVIIAANCQKPVESGCKIFVFFLISQPLVYLVETPFLGVGVWGYYKYWAIITVLTLPGGMIANLIRRKSFFGTLVLSVALCLVAMSASEYTLRTIASFPHHILTVIFCFLEIVVLIMCIVPRKAWKAVAAAIAIAAFVAATFISVNTLNVMEAPLPEGEEWVCTFENADQSTLTCDGDMLSITYSKAFVKENTIICKDKNGQIYKLKVEVSKDRIINLVPES